MADTDYPMQRQCFYFWMYAIVPRVGDIRPCETRYYWSNLPLDSF
jgi:hypothetical protein